MKKALAIMLAMLLAVSAMTGCGKNEENKENKENKENNETNVEQSAENNENNMLSSDCEGNVFAWNLGADVSVDPMNANTPDSMSVVNNTFEGLMRDTGSGIEPAMAESMPQEEENEDGSVTLIYTIREAFWSDGQPVKASDFEFAWKRCADPANGSVNAYLMNGIVGYDKLSSGEELAVKALDGTTLEVTLKQPSPYFNDLLVLPAFMPLREDMVNEDGSWAKDPAKAVSNGPFTVAGYTQGKELVLKKNDQYYNKDSVSIDYIVARMLDEHFAPVGMAFGDIAMTMGEISQPENQTDTQGNTVEVPALPETLEEKTVASNRTTSLLVNANTGNPLLKDKDVRNALSEAIDRTAAANAANGEVLLSVTGSDNILSEQADTAKLAELLEAKTDIEAEDREIEIVYLENETTKAVLDEVKSAWESLGLSVKLTAQSAEEFKLSRNSQQYADILCSVWELDAGDDQLALEPYISSNMQSGCGYTNPEFDQLMLEAMTSSDRDSKLSEAQKLLLDDAYVMPLYRDLITTTSDSAKISGWTQSTNGTYWFGSASVGAAE